MHKKSYESRIMYARNIVSFFKTEKWYVHRIQIQWLVMVIVKFELKEEVNTITFIYLYGVCECKCGSVCDCTLCEWGYPGGFG